MTFKALLLTQADGKTQAEIAALEDDQLPQDGDVLVAIDYSTINFKDGLAITNKSPVVRSWPMVAGIDGSGTVLESRSPAWKPGDAVVLNGFGVGETHKGCLAGKARLKGEWLIRRPAAFSAKQAMAIGTAGYTAMLCVLALERHGVKPGAGEVLVTGASGLIGGIVLDRFRNDYEFSGLNRRPVPGIPCVQADIADFDAIRPAFEGIDTVVHLAGYTGSEDDPGVEDWDRNRAKAVPLGRASTPDECAALIWFLLSDESAYMTGQAINFTGGLVTW